MKYEKEKRDTGCEKIIIVHSTSISRENELLSTLNDVESTSKMFLIYCYLKNRSCLIGGMCN